MSLPCDINARFSLVFKQCTKDIQILNTYTFLSKIFDIFRQICAPVN